TGSGAGEPHRDRVAVGEPAVEETSRGSIHRGEIVPPLAEFLRRLPLLLRLAPPVLGDLVLRTECLGQRIEEVRVTTPAREEAGEAECPDLPLQAIPPRGWFFLGEEAKRIVEELLEGDADFADLVRRRRRDAWGHVPNVRVRAHLLEERLELCRPEPHP